MSDPHAAMTASRERAAWSTSGYLMLLLFLALLTITVWRIVGFAASEPADSEFLGFVVTTGLTVLALILISSGFYLLQPNTAAAITLFGSYRGTDRHAGLRWVWPWMGKPRSRRAPTT